MPTEAPDFSKFRAPEKSVGKIRFLRVNSVNSEKPFSGRLLRWGNMPRQCAEFRTARRRFNEKNTKKVSLHSVSERPLSCTKSERLKLKMNFNSVG